MIIYAIYIIKNDGKPILCERFHSNYDMPNDMLLSGLFIALNGFSRDILNRDINTIILEDLCYHIHSFAYCTIVLVTDLNCVKKNSLLEEVGYRFIKSYGEKILEKDFRTEKFIPFKKIINEIIKAEDLSFDESNSINPSKLLGTAEIFELPYDLKPVALAILALGEATLNQIADECDHNNNVLELEPKVAKLQKLGYIGSITKDRVQHFFCNRLPAKITAA